jgi:hypothetical protein
VTFRDVQPRSRKSAATAQTLDKQHRGRPEQTSSNGSCWGVTRLPCCSKQSSTVISHATPRRDEGLRGQTKSCCITDHDGRRTDGTICGCFCRGCRLSLGLCVSFEVLLCSPQRFLRTPGLTYMLVGLLEGRKAGDTCFPFFATCPP